MSNNRNIAFWLVLFLLIVVLFNVFSSGTSSLQSREISYSDFVASVERGEVATVILDGESIRFKGGDNVEYVTVRPADTNVTDLLIANQVVVRAEKQEQPCGPERARKIHQGAASDLPPGAWRAQNTIMPYTLNTPLAPCRTPGDGPDPGARDDRVWAHHALSHCTDVRHP